MNGLSMHGHLYLVRIPLVPILNSVCYDKPLACPSLYHSRMLMCQLLVSCATSPANWRDAKNYTCSDYWVSPA